MERIKISAVSFLNTRPFIYGLEQTGFINEIDLSLDPPSRCADRLRSGEVSVGLIPIAAISEIKNAEIITGFCIGADGPVASVMMFSDCPPGKIKQVYLDVNSRTSVMLARILAERLWKINPRWIKGPDGFPGKIAGAAGGVVIGDRALELRGKYAYETDLSSEWKRLTGLPFVFACWVTNRKLPAGFISGFGEALRYGTENKVKSLGENPLPAQVGYICSCISYELDERKREGMEIFLKWVAETGPGF